MSQAEQQLAHDKALFPRIDAPCPLVGACGGCTLQDLSYPDQLALKQQRLARVFSPFELPAAIPVHALEPPWRYRHRAELSFGAEQGSVTLGFHAARSFWKIVDLDDCLLLPEAVARVIRDVRALIRETGLSPYFPRRHEGIFRFLLVRSSHADGTIMLCLVTTPWDRAAVDALAGTLMAAHPNLVSVYWGVTSKLADVSAPEELILVRGRAYLEDRLGPFELQVHPLTFLQPTPALAQRLYARMAEWAEGAPSGNAWDFYCGIGVVGFHLAGKYRHVYGVDSEPRNIELGRLNAQRNRLDNVTFHQGRAEDVVADKRFWLLEAKPHLVVVDPPRTGLHERVISTLLGARPAQIIYISCNAEALARDLQRLGSGFPRYRLRRVEAFDLFPHTAHVEVLALLDRA
ncbi:MAG: 23S rRNA (uracil(1939)-C(5))-methyltransferase RlmD [Candidatus Omnitrophica bacterium]|nr:23S rRNA (uracil(1939)-C(5))-methyltransferase RlmD [Candidatus Omnitrophota bacterium]